MPMIKTDRVIHIGHYTITDGGDYLHFLDRQNCNAIMFTEDSMQAIRPLLLHLLAIYSLETLMGAADTKVEEELIILLGDAFSA